jgi:predicted aconitase
MLREETTMSSKHNLYPNEDVCAVCRELRYSQDVKVYPCCGCEVRCCVHRIGDAKQLQTYEILDVLCNQCATVRRINQRKQDLGEGNG